MFEIGRGGKKFMFKKAKVKEEEEIFGFNPVRVGYGYDTLVYLYHLNPKIRTNIKDYINFI